MTRQRSPSWGGRKRINLFKSRYFTYYRNASMEIDRSGVHAGIGGRGWRLRLPGLGALTRSIDADRWSWDTPGWGRLKWTGSFREGLPALPWPLKIWCALVVVCHGVLGALTVLILGAAVIFVLPHIGLIAFLVILGVVIVGLRWS